MLNYDEQNYPVSIKVRVYDGIEMWEDEIKGLNTGHALYLAQLNWLGCRIEVI